MSLNRPFWRLLPPPAISAESIAIKGNGNMSRSARSKPPPSKAAEERADDAPSFDPDAQGPQYPKSSTMIADALSTTTAALSAQYPDVRALQAECEDLIAGDRDTALCDDNLLKLVSVFSYEEILDKYQAAHPDYGLSHNFLSHKINSAKTAVASNRGVDRQQIVDEVKRNQQLSGLRTRRGKVQGRRFWATRERKEASAEDREEDDDADAGDDVSFEMTAPTSTNWWTTHKSAKRRAEAQGDDFGNEGLESDELPTSSAGDELARTTTALNTGTPTLAQLQSDCEALLAGDARRITGYTLLKIFSLFRYEEITAKIATAHGGTGPNKNYLAGRVLRAKKMLAGERGVDGKEIEREIKENRKVSGASKHGRKLIAAERASAGDDAGFAEDGDGPDVSEDQIDIVSSQAGARAADADLGDRDEGPETFHRGLGGNDQSRPARERDDEDEIPNEVDRRQPVQSWPSLLPARTVPPGEIEPFDLRPVGPYAGTPFFVPGFRTDGTITPEEWMRLHPGPYEQTGP